MRQSRVRIAAFGIRALPPSDGCAGAETVAEELYTRIAKKGYEVVVYCRRYWGVQAEYPKHYRGLKLIYLPTVKRQGFDTLVHSLLCTLHIILFNTGKVIHIHNAGNSIWVPLLRLFGKRCFIGVDGFDWKRARWPWYAKIYLRIANQLAIHFATKVIIDNVFVQKYYLDKFGAKLDYIPYGVNIQEVSTSATLDELGLRKNRYILFVGRFIKEKGVHYLINAFEQLQTDLRLVLVGGNLFDDAWVNKLKSTKDPRIVFTGYLYGQSVDELLRHCYLYVQPSDVEGLSPVILRAMGHGRGVVSSDIPENRFLVEGHGYLFEKGNIESIRSVLESLLEKEEEVASTGRVAQAYVRDRYSWDAVAEQHLRLFLGG